jgi:hypothetical protein
MQRESVTQNLKRLTALQCAVAASCTLMMGGTLMSQDNAMGYPLLALAFVFGIGAVVKARAARAKARNTPEDA